VNPTEAGRKETGATATTASPKKKILILDDHPASRRNLQKKLEASGFCVQVVSDGLAGLNAIRKENPDLVILDVVLPGLDGHKVCRMIKFDKNLGRIPVIVWTSRDLDEAAELAKQVKADAFIVKTTKQAVILEIIQRLLEKSEAPEPAA